MAIWRRNDGLRVIVFACRLSRTDSWLLECPTDLRLELSQQISVCLLSASKWSDWQESRQAWGPSLSRPVLQSSQHGDYIIGRKM